LRVKKEQKEKKKKRGDQQSIDHSRENNNRNTDRHSLDQQHSSPIYTHNTIRTAFNIHRDGNRTTTTRAQQEREREYKRRIRSWWRETDSSSLSSRRQNRAIGSFSYSPLLYV
jgi:hypothetical protein